MRATLVARPTTRLPFINTPLIHLAEKNLIATVNYSGTGRDCKLFLVDTRKHRLPDDLFADGPG